MRFPISPLLVSFLFLPWWNAPLAMAADEPQVRILVSERVPAVRVKGKALMIRAIDGKEAVAGVARVSFRPSGTGAGEVLLEGSPARAGGFSVTSEDGFCEVNGEVVRGSVLVSPSPNGEGKGAGLLLAVALPLESYLVGLVNGEVNSAWPAEAVKAQVVAARTYAMGRLALSRGAAWDMKPDTSHQVYPGVFGEDPDAARAVRETRGLVLTRQGRPVEALFHSTCGGRTAAAEEVWGTPAEGSESIECGDCGGSPQSRWEVTIPADEISAAVNRLYPGSGAVAALAVRSLTPSGRVRSLSVTARGGAFLLEARDLRREVGNVRLPSTAFTVRPGPGGFLFTGRGYGHGAGLCQWGARGAAVRGLGYAEILRRYYPGAEVTRAYR